MIFIFRYMKNLSFNRIKEILSDKTVGIAGCGGLGSNCAVSLARVGIGNLIIADFDFIDEGNLNRQFYFYDQIGKKKAPTLKKNIHLINPNVNIEAHDLKLDEDLIKMMFNKCDVIVEAFDGADAKQMIIETVLSEFPDIPLVCGVGMAGFGETNLLKMEQHDNLYICGDQQYEVADDLPPLAPRVCIVSNMQANVVLEVLLGRN
jgi:sulfur carrier protein ThiS adenylyltransferase